MSEEKISIERFGNNFTVLTKHEKLNVEVKEVKDAKGLVEWMDAKRKEVEQLSSELKRNNDLMAQATLPNPERERVSVLLKERLDSCKSLDELKEYLLDLHSGKMQDRDKVQNLKDNYKYLLEKKESLEKTLNGLSNHLVEAKRLLVPEKK